MLPFGQKCPHLLLCYRWKLKILANFLNLPGQGAWQEWLYEVRVQDHSTRVFIYVMNITETSTTVRNLRPNTSYSVKVRAYSPGGRGPWSLDFVGRTLKPRELSNNASRTLPLFFFLKHIVDPWLRPPLIIWYGLFLSVFNSLTTWISLHALECK